MYVHAPAQVHDDALVRLIESEQAIRLETFCGHIAIFQAFICSRHYSRKERERERSNGLFLKYNPVRQGDYRLALLLERMSISNICVWYNWFGVEVS